MKLRVYITTEKSNSNSIAEYNYVWNNLLNWLEVLGHSADESSKNET